MTISCTDRNGHSVTSDGRWFSASKSGSRTRNFARDEDGGVLIEHILWLPFLTLFLLSVLDASFIYMNYARAQLLVQSGARAYTVGEFETCDQLKNWLEPEIRNISPSATASCARNLSIASVSVSLSAREMDITGALSIIGDIEIDASAIHTFEQASSS